MLKYWTALRSFNTDIKRLLLLWALNAFSYLGIMGVLLNLYLLRLGYDVEFIGLFLASGQMVWAAASLPVGALCRRISLRTGILIAPASLGLGMVGILVVEWLPPAIWVPWLIGSWMLAWVGAAFLTVASAPYIMGAASLENRNYAFGIQGVLIALFSFIGSAVAGVLPALVVTYLGGTLDDPGPYRTVLWLVPLAYLLAFLIFLPATPRRIESSADDAITERAPVNLLVFLGVIVFLPALGGGSARAFINVFLDVSLNVHPARIGLVMGIGQLLPVFATMITPYLLERWGAPRTLIFSSTTMGFALIVLGSAGHWLLAGIAFAVIVSMIMVTGTSNNVFSQELVAPRWRTMSVAVITIGVALGWATSAALGSYLITSLGFAGFFFVCAALAFVAAPILLAYLRGLRPAPTPTPGD